MNELAPQLQEDLAKAVDSAKVATRRQSLASIDVPDVSPAYNLDVSGSMTAERTVHETMDGGPHLEDPRVHVSTVKNNDPTKPEEFGAQVSQKVRATTRKTLPGGGYADYGAEVTDQAGGEVAGHATVTRKTADGQEYRHTFKNPETAQKFGALVSKQVAERANAETEQLRQAA